MLKVYFTNFHYYADQVFETLEAALEYGKSKCFEFSVSEPGGDVGVRNIVATWSPVGGTRIWKEESFV